MAKAVSAEWIKMKKNRIFLVCSLIVLLSAVLVITKDLFTSRPPTDPIAWLQSDAMITGLVLSVMSSFTLTFSMQREYEDKTILGVLTAPTSRVVYLFSKLTVWFVWYLAVLIATEVIYMIGGFLLYPGKFAAPEIKFLFLSLTKCRLLGFVASLPLLWVAVLQKRTFYPTVMISLIFTGIELAALNMPVLFASAIPWSAVPLVGLFDAPTPYVTIGWISILLTGAIGLFLAIFSFKRQDQ